MAARRCSRPAALLILCSLSAFVVADGQEATLAGGHRAPAADGPRRAAETAEEPAELPAAEGKRWEVTPDDAAAADTRDTSAPGAVPPSPAPQHRDDFQEELVIRPLHSGDIYASFQFRTLWETDFMRGNKGELTVSSR